MARRRVVCPRCGITMEYRVEVEIGDGVERKIHYYYRCPRCSYKLVDVNLRLRRNNGKIVLEAEMPLTVKRPSDRKP
ncbi:MAG: hypothetical protein ABWW69_06605 [Pyrodictiaceae archaeon]